jgi:hypothetical protein
MSKCVSWSINDTKQWWWPTPPGQSRWPGKYWPYAQLGFEACDRRDYEEGHDKIAIYVDHAGNVAHAARWWLEDGGWSSKLGEENDILHHSLGSLEGACYGVVAPGHEKAEKPKREMRFWLKYSF